MYFLHRPRVQARKRALVTFGLDRGDAMLAQSRDGAFQEADHSSISSELRRGG